MMAAQEIQMDLLDALRADADGALARKLLAQLREIDQRLQRRLRQLNDRDTYLKLSAAKQAVTSAINVLETLTGGRRGDGFAP
jgi:hypothetical protein